MATYDLGKVVGDKGEQGDDGNGIVSITKTSTSGLVDTYTILFTNGTTTTFEVTNGSSGIADIVTSWSATLHDDKVPSEKLAKNSLDAKLDNAISSTAVTIASNDNILITDYSDSNKVKRVSSILASQVKDSNAHSNIGSSANASQSTINTNIDTALSGKANSSSLSTVATTGSYNDLTNKPTIPSITGLEETANKVTSWSTTTTDIHYPSEKLVKTSLDAKANSSSLSTVATSGSYNDLTNKPTIPSASTSTPSADTTSGSYGSGTSYARSNHTHPKSSLYAESTHTHTKSQISDFPSLSTVATSGSYSDLSNKPTIPSSSSDLSDGSDLVKKSSTSGLLKNDGSVDTSAYITSSALPTIQTSWGNPTSDLKVASEKLTKDTLDTKIAKSSTSGLVKNDGTIDTSAYITSSAISGMLTTSDIANNLTTTTTGKVLDARQGKALSDLIGQAITYINQ